MSDTTWQGGVSTDASNAANWSAGVPSSTVNAIFTSSSANNCDISQLTACLNLEIKSDFDAELITTGTATIDVHGTFIVGLAGTIKPTHAIEFEFQNSPTYTVYDSDGSSYTNKPHVVLTIDTGSMFANETARSNTTFDFGSTTFTMIDGVYPNITFTGTMYAKIIYGSSSLVLHNNYGSVDIYDIETTGNIVPDVANIYDYNKTFYFEDISTLGQRFEFGFCHLRLKANSQGHLLPTTGSRGSNIYGNSTNKIFTTQYRKITIENQGTTNYWSIAAGSTLDCNELIIRDGGRLYGPGNNTRAATIKTVKRPSIRGDWNFRQISDGIYESVGDYSNTSVYEGGTGLDNVTVNALLYGNGKDPLGQLSLGSAGDVLAVNGAGNGIEWSSTGGTNIELDELSDVTITSPTELQVLIYNGSEWVNGWPEVKMIQIRNDEGSTIPAGAPLYSRGEIGGSNRILVGIADANDSAKMPCIGIAYEEMNTTTTKDNYGVVSGVYNTNLTGFSGLSDGDIVYVKNWTGTPTSASDVLTTTRPTDGSEEVQNVGIILKTNGTIIQGLLVSAIGRSNDIPNATITTNSADADYVYIDDGNVWKKITPANLGIGAGSDTNTFVIVGEESDDYISSTAAAGNANGYQFSYGNGAQNTSKSSSGSDFGVMIPVACTLSRLDFTFGNIGSEDNTSNQTITVYKNAASTTTTVTFNCSGSGGNAFTKSFSSLSGNGLSYSAGDRFNLRTTGLSGYTNTQIGPARMTAYFTIA